MKLDIISIYRDRVSQIDIDIKKCIKSKNWSKKRILESEKSDLLQKINKK